MYKKLAQNHQQRPEVHFLFVGVQVTSPLCRKLVLFLPGGGSYVRHGSFLMGAGWRSYERQSCGRFWTVFLMALGAELR